MLKARPTPSADRASRMRAQHVGRRISAPANNEGHQRNGHAVTAGIAAQPKPVWLMQQCA